MACPSLFFNNSSISKREKKNCIVIRYIDADVRYWYLLFVWIVYLHEVDGYFLTNENRISTFERIISYFSCKYNETIRKERGGVKNVIRKSTHVHLCLYNVCQLQKILKKVSRAKSEPFLLCFFPSFLQCLTLVSIFFSFFILSVCNIWEKRRISYTYCTS